MVKVLAGDGAELHGLRSWLGYDVDAAVGAIELEPLAYRMVACPLPATVTLVEEATFWGTALDAAAR